MEKVLPGAGGSVLQAIREKTEGVTNKHEAPVFFGREQLKGDWVDTIIRGLSANPAEIQKKKDVKWSEKEVDREYNERRFAIYDRIRRDSMASLKRIAPKINGLILLMK